MSEQSSPAKAASQAMFYFGIIGMSIYFSHAAIQGDYGLMRLFQLEHQESELEAELAALESDRAALANRTRRLSDDYLDLDLLDERARDVLGYVRYDEIVVR